MRHLIFPASCFFLLAGFVQTVTAELQPNEVAVLCARDSLDSRRVAAYYAKVRGIPTENILSMTLPTGPVLARLDWQTKVRPVIRRWLAEGDRRSRIRCFVTTWDVPLKISRAEDDPEVQRLISYLADERDLRVTQLRRFVQTLNRWGGDDGAESVQLNALSGLEDIKAALDTSFGAAQSTVGKITDETDRGRKLQELQSIYFRSVGLNMMVQSLARQLQSGTSGINPKMRSEFDVARGRALGLREGRSALEGTPYGLDREPQLLALIQLSDGIYGTLAWIDEQVRMLKKNESYASFDSELSSVTWPDYALIRWQPNPLNYRYDESALRKHRPTIMVSRLEGPTLKRMREIIDQAVQVEKTGLKGKVYLDARAADQPGYKEYDQSLITAAELIEKHTDLEVVLDTKQALFQEDSAPEAALYCGWYSLGKYVDAFDWVPGAVAYHMASSEAATLRDPTSQVWCKRMLEEGVAATLGPVYEPYVAAFPPPNQFFALLLSGKFTLVESYYRCLPHTSWTMTLVGDPLYSPFKATPALRMDGLDPLTRRILLGPDSAVGVQDADPPAAGDGPTASSE